MSESKRTRSPRGRRPTNGKAAHGTDEAAPAPPLASPSSEQVLSTILELSRSMAVDMHADEVVHRYVDQMQKLLPGRLFCVRLVEPQGGALKMVYATGRLDHARRNRLELSREAAERHSVDPQAARAGGLVTSDDYHPVFREGERGFDVPLLDDRRVSGVLSVEYRAGVEPPAEDRSLVVQLALQLGSALRNSRLHRESVYLRDYLSKLLDSANAPIMVMGRDGQVTLANRAFLATTGFRREEVLGKDCLSLLPESDRRRLLPIYISALRGEPTTNVEVRLPRRDGSFAHVAVNTASILSPDGDVEGVIYIYRDVTEVRELEEQIIHAEKLATLGQLAAGVVHELNNPLTSIAAYGDYLRRKYEKQGEQGDAQKLERIVASADRILKFTRDLVTYARPSTEKPLALDVHQLIDQALSFCEHLIDEVGARVDKRYHDDLPQAYGVKGQLVQVFVNLVTNACHAIPQGAGQITIETEGRDDGRLAVRVIDNGKGITEENLERIFEPFFTTKGEGKGTGLGLSIVRNIVEQHRGEIAVRSNIGEGTTFEVSLVCGPEPKDSAPA